mmetsp:Transcript_1855/g.2869  ORF Transcript_1855/g.2869 Transcript_1855/m.2869 type:complete len:253 (+) Transcript_1855:416-1174(+)
MLVAVRKLRQSSSMGRAALSGNHRCSNSSQGDLPMLLLPCLRSSRTCPRSWLRAACRLVDHASSDRHVGYCTCCGFASVSPAASPFQLETCPVRLSPLPSSPGKCGHNVSHLPALYHASASLFLRRAFSCSSLLFSASSFLKRSSSVTATLTACSSSRMPSIALCTVASRELNLIERILGFERCQRLPPFFLSSKRRWHLLARSISSISKLWGRIHFIPNQHRCFWWCSQIEISCPPWRAERPSPTPALSSF